MDSRLFYKILEETHEYLTRISINGQGEPLLDSHFVEKLEIAKKWKVSISKIFTNGQLLEKYAKAIVDSGIVKNLVIGIEGATQEVYEKYRKNGKLSYVLKGIASIVEQKKKKEIPRIQVNTTLLKTNFHEIKAIQEMVKNCPVERHRIKACWFPGITKKNPWLDPEFYNTWLPEDKKFWGFPVGEFQGKLKIQMAEGQNKNECPWHYYQCFIGWDGTVYACDCDQLCQNLAMGTLDHNTTIAQIWNGEQYRKQRRQIRDNISSHPFCQNCPRFLGSIPFLDHFFSVSKNP
jgi:radical SAM protein with 4Fe4S-binding SPASM domain